MGREFQWIYERAVHRLIRMGRHLVRRGLESLGEEVELPFKHVPVTAAGVTRRVPRVPRQAGRRLGRRESEGEGEEQFHVNWRVRITAASLEPRGGSGRETRLRKQKYMVLASCKTLASKPSALEALWRRVLQP